MKITEKIEELLNYSQIKKILIALLVGIVVTGYASQYANRVTADISKNVVRLHVLANSDSTGDQQLKLSVRDAVIEYLYDKLKDSTGPKETKEIIKSELDNITTAAQNIVNAQGYGYTVSAVLGNFDFPVKYYNDTRFPAGGYDALRILIGEAKGENWWCVLYPQLCFNGNMTTEGKEKLKKVLSEDEFKLVADKRSQYKLKFKILELFKQQKN